MTSALFGYRFKNLFRTKVITDGDDLPCGVDMTMLCHVDDNPNRIFQLIRDGKESTLTRYLTDHEEALEYKDLQSRTPVHLAVQAGLTQIVNILINMGADVNAQAQCGSTPIHLAIESGHIQIARLLLQNGAHIHVTDNEGRPPLHVAVTKKNSDMIQTLISFDDSILTIQDDHGRSALHVAAVGNDEKISRVLLDLGAELVPLDKKGMTPFHVACAVGSTDAMHVMLERGDKLGVSRSFLVQNQDNDNNMPLHAAVCGGHIEAAVLCIMNGADLEALQDSKSTPIHFASARGCHYMVAALVDAWRRAGNDIVHAVNLKDANGMTALHLAAMFDHANIVEYLLNEGAAIDAQDNEQRTPVYLAASKSAFNTWELLLKSGADPSITDSLNRNFFHAAIINDAKPQLITKNEGFCSLVGTYMNRKDVFGCTPLHYASEMGFVVSALELMKHGATLNCINNDQETPLHFAAKYGRLNTCRALLSTEQGRHMVNMKDRQGRSVLHMAAENGHDKVVVLMMRSGAIIHKDVRGNLPIHLAAVSNYPRTIRALLGVYPHIINATDNQGNTPLHAGANHSSIQSVIALLDEDAAILYNNDDATFFDLMIQQKYNEAADDILRHKRWRNVMDTPSKLYPCYMMGLIVNMPGVAMTLLDRCVTVEQSNRCDNSLESVYDFSYLQAPMEAMMDLRRHKKEFQPLPALNSMVVNNRTDCITHRVCKAYLDMKWEAYGGCTFMFNLGIYVLFLSALTYVTWVFNNKYHTDPGGPPTEWNRLNNDYKDMYTAPIKVALVVLAVYCFLNVIKEFVQMWNQRLSYFVDLTNYVEWGVYLATATFVYPALMGMSTHVQWESAAVAIMLAYINFLLFFQSTEVFGIYVVMFTVILTTLIKVLLVFLILFAAFSFCFFILLSKYTSPLDGFNDPSTSFLTVGMMMIGEINYRDSFLPGLYNTSTGPTDFEQHFPLLTIIMLACFLIIMPILLMNLMIGLAVGDIESVRRDALLKRTAMQVEVYTNLERKLPITYLIRMDQQEYRPHQCGRFAKLMMTRAACAFGGGSLQSDSSDTRLNEELRKQKQRMKGMMTTIEKQTSLLRLIVEKMEIRTEAEDQDEGASPAELRCRARWNNMASKFKKPKGSTSTDKNALVSVWQIKKPKSRTSPSGQRTSGDTNGDRTQPGGPRPNDPGGRGSGRGYNIV